MILEIYNATFFERLIKLFIDDRSRKLFKVPENLYVSKKWSNIDVPLDRSIAAYISAALLVSRKGCNYNNYLSKILYERGMERISKYVKVFGSC